jgi:Flp pilus assembly protein TadG
MWIVDHGVQDLAMAMIELERIRCPAGKQRTRGQAMVEFAIAAPVVFLVLLGLFDVGRLVFSNNELSEAAREGARWGAVQGRAAAEVAGDNTAVTDQVRSRIDVAPAPAIAISCGYRRDPENEPGDCGPGDLLTIDVSSDVKPITPLIGDIIGPLEIASRAQMTVH